MKTRRAVGTVAFFIFGAIALIGFLIGCARTQRPMGAGPGFSTGSATSLAPSTSLVSINFSCLGPITSLGPVAVNDADTAELFALHAVSAEAWRKIQPASIVPEQVIARADLLNEEADSLYNFTKTYPSSFWTPAIQSRLGAYYRRHGRYSRALELFESAWQATKSFDVVEVKQVADYTLGQYLSLQTALGRFETLTGIFEETANRRLPFGGDASLYARAHEAFSHMAIFPGTNYRCGTFALANAADAEFGMPGFIPTIKRFNSPREGFSVQALEQISDELKMGFVPVFWNDKPGIVVPSVVHWKANHYAAIVAQHGSWYTVLDPTSRSGPALFHANDILAEASGIFLVPQNKVPNEWRTLTAEEKVIFQKPLFIKQELGLWPPTNIRGSTPTFGRTKIRAACSLPTRGMD